MRRGKRGRYVAGPVLAKIEEYIDKGWGPTQIYTYLRDNINPPYKAPSLRTIQDIVREKSGPDPSGRWALNDADPDEATLILPALADVIQETEGRRAYLTRAQAELIGRIRRVAPELNGWAVYRLARLYLFREGRGEPPSDIEGFLAFAPWRSQKQRDAYQRALENEWIPEITSMAPGLWREYGHEGP